MPTADRPVAVILAGGAASRMGGGDKPLLDIGGTSMLARLVAALAPETAAVAISANGDPARFAAFQLPVLSDGPFLGEGPLAGVLAGLDWAAGMNARSLLTVPGDTPFIPAGLATALAPAPACAASDGQPHPLVALWPVACKEQLRALLASPGPRQVRRFGASIGMRRVDFPSGPWDRFFNVNTPDQLAQARALAHDLRTER